MNSTTSTSVSMFYFVPIAATPPTTSPSCLYESTSRALTRVDTQAADLDLLNTQEGASGSPCASSPPVSRFSTTYANKPVLAPKTGKEIIPLKNITPSPEVERLLAEIRVKTLVEPKVTMSDQNPSTSFVVQPRGPAWQRYFEESSPEERILKYMQSISTAETHVHVHKDEKGTTKFSLADRCSKDPDLKEEWVRLTTPMRDFFKLKKALAKIKEALQASSLSPEDSEIFKKEERDLQAQFNILKNYLASSQARNDISALRVWSKDTPLNSKIEEVIEQRRDLIMTYLYDYFVKFYQALAKEDREDLDTRLAGIELDSSWAPPKPSFGFSHTSTASTAASAASSASAASLSDSQGNRPNLSVDARRRVELTWDL